MSDWTRIVTQRRLTDEPYPRSKYKCEDCDNGWDDTEDPTCICEDEEEESEDELQRIEWERIKRR